MVDYLLDWLHNLFVTLAGQTFATVADAVSLVKAR